MMVEAREQQKKFKVQGQAKLGKLARKRKKRNRRYNIQIRSRLFRPPGLLPRGAGRIQLEVEGQCNLAGISIRRPQTGRSSNGQEFTYSCVG